MAGYGESESNTLMDVSQTEKLCENGVEAGSKGLKRTMGYRQGFSLMVGLILGSGVFLSAGMIAEKANSHGMIITIWITSGFLAMMGALCYCELAAIFNVAGSNYTNVLKIYGRIPGFLCAWTTCLVIDPSSIAALGLTIGVYTAKPFYPSDEEAESTAKLISACVIIVACIINCISVECSSRVQSVFVVAQISSVFFVICLGFWQIGLGNFDNFQDMFNTTRHCNVTETDAGHITHIGMALFGALWSYDGWALMSNAIEEMKNVQRNLILIVSTAFPFVIVCYTLVTVSFLTLLDRRVMGASKAVGIEFAKRALGKNGSFAMMAIIGLASFGTLNATLFAVPRLTLAAAREGHMPKFFSLIRKKTQSPLPATCLTAFIALLMLVPRASDLDKLILLFSQAQWILYSASFMGVIILRIRKPDIKRPFRVFIGIPVITFLVSITLVVIPFFTDPYFSLTLMGFIFAGVPVYFLFVSYQPKLPCRMGIFIKETLQTHCGMIPCISAEQA